MNTYTHKFECFLLTEKQYDSIIEGLIDRACLGDTQSADRLAAHQALLAA